MSSTEPVSTGLDLYRQMVTDSDPVTEDESPAQDGCPNRRGLVLLCLETGEAVPVRCGRLGCDYCLVRNAMRRGLAIALMAPRRGITLTLAANEGDATPWATVRVRVKRTRDYVRRMGHEPGEWDYHVEANPKETGYHVHAWQHGPYLPKRVLQEAAHRAGGGWTRIEEIRKKREASSYGLKLAAATYGLKGADSEPHEYLRLNGRRLSHHSRNFYRSPTGARIGVRTAEKLALRELHGERQGTWRLVTENSATWWASQPALKPLA
jgi:hypothetical protein